MAEYIPPKAKRYLTLDDPPEGRFCRLVRLPDDPLWIGLFDGLFSSLVDEWQWRQSGTLTEEEMAQIWLEIFLDQQDSPVCTVDDLSPYWDDSDADDAEGTPSESTFSYTETLADWAVTAFLAASFSPVAAVAYVTTAQKFRVAFRTRDYGRIVRIFLDDVFQIELDTYSAAPGVVYQDIFTPGVTGFSAFDVPSWTLRIEAVDDANPAATPTADGYGMEIIRKRLWTGEVSPDNLRYNEDCDCVQETFDGGETWVDRPLNDPRHAPQFRFPPIDADDPRCQAAANAAQWLEEFIEETLFMLAAGGTVVTLVTLFVTLFLVLGPWAIVVTILIPIAQALYEAGETAITGAFTVEMFNTLECIFYCRMDDSGQVDAAALVGINADVDDQIGGLAAAVLHLIFFAMGEVGLSNTGAQGEAPADCDECECDWCHEFTGADYLTVWSASGNGTHSASGYTNTAPINLRHIEFDYVITGAGSGGDSAAAIFSQNNFTGRIVLVAPLASSGTVVWDGELNGSTGVAIFCNDDNQPGSSISITRVLERGVGPAPYSQNCE